MDDCNSQALGSDGCTQAAEVSKQATCCSSFSHHKPQQGTLKQEQKTHSNTDDGVRQLEHAVLQQLDRLQLTATAVESQKAPTATAVESQKAPTASDLVTLNVGGKLFTCQRQTLCLVEESLLGMMFSGRWPEHDARDADGNMFLDLDPELFEVVINWLRRFNISRAGNIPEPVVPEDKVVHMVVMLDYLLLHRHIPITYQGAFDQQYYSPFMMVHGATATRTGLTAQHKGRHRTDAVKNNLMQFAVTDTAHSFFDMLVDVTVEVTSFTADAAAANKKPPLMFIGFMSKAAAADLDPAGEIINTQLTKSPSCYGWLVSSNGSHTVRNGTRSEKSCTKNAVLWSQGDQLVLTLDTRRDRPCANISILNTRTGEQKTIDAEPVIGSSSSSSSQPEDDQGKGSAGSSSNSRSRRLGLRHRRRTGPVLGGIRDFGRQDILAVLDRQPLAGNVESHLAEIVVAAAMQVLEAQDIQLQDALDILRRPGLIQRLVRQVRNVQQIVRDHAEGPGDRQPQQQQQQCPATTAAANGVSGAADRSATASDAEQSDAVSGTSQPLQQQVAPLSLRNGHLLPQSTSDYDWVLVVGLVRPCDSVKLLRVSRRGQRPKE